MLLFHGNYWLVLERKMHFLHDAIWCMRALLYIWNIQIMQNIAPKRPGIDSRCVDGRMEHVNVEGAFVSGSHRTQPTLLSSLCKCCHFAPKTLAPKAPYYARDVPTSGLLLRSQGLLGVLLSGRGGNFSHSRGASRHVKTCSHQGNQMPAID